MRKKGFTLVELLAVIVVLAITALIATHEDLANVQSPKILQILNNAVQIIQQQGNKTPLLFLRATIKVVGKYNTYLSEFDGNTVFNYLQFLTAFAMNAVSILKRYRSILQIWELNFRLTRQ